MTGFWGRCLSLLCLAGLTSALAGCAGRDNGSIDFDPPPTDEGTCEGSGCTSEPEPCTDCDGCTTDTDCGGTTPRCSSNRNVCVECVSSADCSQGDDAPVCSANGACVECASDTDCSEGERAWCLSGSCAECRSDADCTDGEEGICSLSQGECVECETDADCRSADSPTCVVAEGECE